MIETRRISSREEWLRWRLDDVTASDVAAVAGFSSHRSPLAVWHEKVTRLPNDFDSNILQRGRWLEPAVIAALRERKPTWKVQPAGVYLRDPDIRLGATPDAVAEIPGWPGVCNIQIKVVAHSVFESEWADDAAPLEYQVQTLTEGLLMEASHSVIAAFVIGEFSAELELRDVPRHREAEERAVAVARDFWRRVAENDPPAMDYAQDGELLKRLYPASTPGVTVDLSRDNRIGDLLAQHEAVEQQRKDLEKAEKALETEVKEKLGAAEGAIVPGWRVTFKSSSRKGYEVQPTTLRTLRIKRESLR